MATSDYSPRCKLPGCNNPRYYDPTRGLLGFCGKSHAEEYRYYERTGIRRRSRRTITNGEDAEAPLCRNRLCSRTCHPREDGGYYNYCGKSCAKIYRDQSRSRASSTPDGEDAETPLCRNPSCSRTCHPREDGGYFNYCGKRCAKIYRDLSRSRASSTPDGEDDEAPLCRNPSCSRTCHPNGDGGYFKYCGKRCAEICRNPSRSRASSTQVIVEINRRAPDFQEVSRTFTEQWVKPSLLPAPTHLKIFKVCNQLLETRFQTYIQSLRHQSTEAHFHGTALCCDLAHTKSACTQPGCGICGISRRGFDPGKIGSNISRFKRFGNGMYLAPNSSKCHEYTQGCNGYRALILCDVAPGRKYIETHDQTKLKAPPPGYDSVYGQHGGRLNYDEIVLYDEDAILPKYVIMYQKDGVGQIAT